MNGHCRQTGTGDFRDPKQESRTITIDEYADWAATFARQPAASRQSPDLAYLGLGLSGETDEVVEHIKKFVRDGAWNPERLADEFGDLAYYWARLCVAAGNRPSDVLGMSVEKIEQRLGLSTHRDAQSMI